MGADRIKVAQQSDRPALIRSPEIPENFLYHQLCSAIWVCNAKRKILSDRKRLRLPVDRSGGTENHALYAVLLHFFKKTKRTVNIVVVIR